MKKFLIVGLGNIGEKYRATRHNIGFQILEALAEEHGVSFTLETLGALAELPVKGRLFFLLKPSTYMNLSGKSVSYWMLKKKIPPENILVVTDDLHIDFGTIRLKAKGSAGGHNGLKDIQEKLHTTHYPRFRFGIGANYRKGHQADFVLEEWTEQEKKQLPERIAVSCKLILSFGLAGIQRTMSDFNGT